MNTVSEEWGMACPACGRDDSLDIAFEAWTRLTADGTDDSLPADSTHEWGEASACICSYCNWSGTVADTEIGEPA